MPKAGLKLLPAPNSAASPVAWAARAGPAGALGAEGLLGCRPPALAAAVGRRRGPSRGE
jgi:hypothetical protein